MSKEKTIGIASRNIQRVLLSLLVTIIMLRTKLFTSCSIISLKYTLLTSFYDTHYYHPLSCILITRHHLTYCMYLPFTACCSSCSDGFNCLSYILSFIDLLELTCFCSSSYTFPLTSITLSEHCS